MNELSYIEIAIIAFFDDKGQIMLNKRADAQTEMWELIGGGIESGETPEEAIKREVFEEVGYKINPQRDNLNFHKQFIYQNKKFIAKVFCYTATFPGLEKLSDSDETFVKDLELIDIADARQRVLLPMTKIVVDGL